MINSLLLESDQDNQEQETAFFCPCDYPKTSGKLCPTCNKIFCVNCDIDPSFHDIWAECPGCRS